MEEIYCYEKAEFFLIWGLIFTLLASTVSPNFVSAKELESKESVLSESILYNFDTKKNWN